MRAYARTFAPGHSQRACRPRDDDWTQGQAGQRGDWERGADRYCWRVAPGMELPVIGPSLNGGHVEYGVASVRTGVPRTVGVKLTWER
jgi:hypothetical protein